MKRYLPYLFVLGLLMVSCVRDVEIDLEDLPDRIVLNASVCPGKEVCAHLSKTWFIMDSVPDFELSDAKVRVYVNDEFQGLMRNDDLPEDSIHSRGQYVLPGCFVRQGDCLRIEAEADGYEPVSGKLVSPVGHGFMRWIPYPIDLLPTMPNICVSLLKSGLRRIPIIV